MTAIEKIQTVITPLKSIDKINEIIEKINNTWSAWATSLSGKLNTDMSNLNPTQTAKDTVVGWGMPDYNSAISQSALTEYTATTNGYIHCFNYTAGQLTITLNGTLYYWCSGGGGNILTGCNFMMPVNKGDTYKLNNAFSNPSFCFLNFYPVKGVN